jgi:hypothetical protein
MLEGQVRLGSQRAPEEGSTQREKAATIHRISTQAPALYADALQL